MSLSYRESMLAAMRGELSENMVFAPRLELWYFPNQQAGTLPQRHQGKSHRQISLDEGWAWHTVVADYFNQPDPDAALHRAIGVHRLDQHPFRIEFNAPLEAEVVREGDRVRIIYHTPKGELSTCTVHSAEMKKAGIAVPHIEEHAVKTPEDLEIAASLFRHLDVRPEYERYSAYIDGIGGQGVIYCNFTAACSPMHHIQRYLMESNRFFFYYKDHYQKLCALCEAMTPWYEKGLQVLAASPVDVVNWGANYDDTITYPPYFEKEFLPWIKKASLVLGGGGVLNSSHTDGENHGLMDLIASSGMDVAEAVCPAPMTKVSLAEYHRRWSGNGITIFGGIPSNLLLPETCSQAELTTYMDELFKVVGDGSRFIAAVADSVPPGADFDRLVYIGERINEEGRLPLKAGGGVNLGPDAMQKALNLISKPEILLGDPGVLNEISQILEQIGQGFIRLSQTIAALEGVSEPEAEPPDAKDASEAEVPTLPEEQGSSLFSVKMAVLSGDGDQLLSDLKALLDEGVDAGSLLNEGMLAAMEEINKSFVDGTVFIPEVLLSARALNRAIAYLEPYLGEEGMGSPTKVLVGTVKGDLHDIGKNLVLTMLKGAGFDAIDLGIDVSTEAFIRAVKEHKPDVLGLSALLTTTMPRMAEVIQALKEAGLRSEVKVIVGGAPVNQKYAYDIGADGYAANGGEAVDLVKSI